MKLELLRRTHPDYDRAALQRHDDLFAGGEQFLKNVAKYLVWHRPVEPKEVFEARCRAAHYINYCAPIASYFKSWLFSSPLTYASEPAADPFYATFREDCDALGTSLDAFLGERLIEAMVARRAHWRVDFPAAPEGETVADRTRWEELGLGRAALTAMPAAAVTHWKKDAQGEYVWLVEHACTRELADFTDLDATVTETWTLWARDGRHRRWQLTHAAGETPDRGAEVPEVAAPADRVGGLPVVTLELPPELWLMGHLASPALAHFRKDNALAWAMDRTCYAMPVLFSASKKPIGKMGAGYYLQFGKDDKFEWSAPPSGAFTVIADYVGRLKDEIHRVAQQMARGVENNAATVGRSGDSKKSDDRATEIVLRAFGVPTRGAAERTHDLVSAGRGEALVWSVGGMDTYHVTDAETITSVAVAGQPLNIPSVTARRELFKRVTFAQLPDLDEKTKTQIAKEIDAGVTPEDLLPPPPPALDPAATDPAPADGSAPPAGA